MIGEKIIVAIKKLGAGQAEVEIIFLESNYKNTTHVLKAGGKIEIDINISLMVRKIEGRQVKIDMIAPRDIAVHREEVYLKIKKGLPKSLQKESVLLP